MRSMLVIGLGRFGNHLALRLMELGNEVMVVDRDEENVNKIAPDVTRAQIGDCMDEDVLRSLGVGNFDVCFVCISEDFQSSLEITSLLDELGAKFIVSKADRQIHAKFLIKVGADEVIYPERDMAQRTAMRFTAKNAYDYVELSPEYAIFELGIPASWIGKTLRELDVRSKHGINIIGLKTGGHIVPIASADHHFEAGEHIVAAGGKAELLEFVNVK